MSLRVADIIEVLGGSLHGSGERVIHRIASPDCATPQDLSFVASDRDAETVQQSHAGCLLVGSGLEEAARAHGDCIVADEPLLYFAALTRLWRERHQGMPAPGVHPSAVVEEGAQVDPSATIGPLCHIGRNARIGAGTVLQSRVTVGHDCVIGARCLILSGAVIGGDGFGFAPHEGRWVRIEQLGAVRIGDDVEIGANTCVDRGTLEDTVIEDGVKLDNLIQIAHNCHVGRHTAMAGCVGVAGSARIGAHCTVGGAGMIAGHITICDHVQVTAATMITHSIDEPGRYTAYYPMDEHGTWERNAATLRRLYQLRQRVSKLERAQRRPQET